MAATDGKATHRAGTKKGSGAWPDPVNSSIEVVIETGRVALGSGCYPWLYISPVTQYCTRASLFSMYLLTASS